MLLDSENINEEKQLKLNSLENVDNEIRAIFAVNMLNEGWDVLNLFDIVRLYDTRDGKWIKGINKPGNTTMSEAQLIGRGARYYPFQLNETYDKYKRKFDDDIENECDFRIIALHSKL
jgi:type III restriction enzyme